MAKEAFAVVRDDGTYRWWLSRLGLREWYDRQLYYLKDEAVLAGGIHSLRTGDKCKIMCIRRKKKRKTRTKHEALVGR